MRSPRSGSRFGAWNNRLECRQWLPDGDVLTGGVGGCCREAGGRLEHLNLQQHAPATDAQPSSHPRRVDALTDGSVTGRRQGTQASFDLVGYASCSVRASRAGERELPGSVYPHCGTLIDVSHIFIHWNI